MINLSTSILNMKEIAPLSNMIDGGALPALVTGLSPIHRAHLASALRHKMDMPIFIICPDDTSAEQTAKNMESFLNIEVPVLLTRELSLYSAEGVSRTAEHNRIKTLYALTRGECPVLVCAVSALLIRTAPPEILESFAFSLKVGETVELEKIERQLVSSGYIFSEQISGVGQFSKRGGILDFFSPAYKQPVRCEFWGDDLDSMGFFEVENQRRTENIQEAIILPAMETIMAADSNISETLETILQKLRKKKTNPQLEKLIETLEYDTEKIRENMGVSSADRYLSLVYEKKATALDYIPYDALVFLDQPSKITEHAKEYLRELTDDLRSLTETGILLKSLADFSIDQNGLFEKLSEFPLIFMDAFTFSRFPIEPQSIISVNAKQLPCYSGNGDAVSKEAETYKKLKYRTIILAADERRAKLLQSMLQARGISASLDLELSKLPEGTDCTIAIGGFSCGFEYESIKLAVLSDMQFVRKQDKKKNLRGTHKEHKGKKIDSYADLSVGDLVVHDIHGIGRFEGIIQMEIDGVYKDYIKISYAGADSLYVPVTQLDLVYKYVGASEDKTVKLSKMGGVEWKKTKTRAKAAAKIMAKELIRLYAERRNRPGYAFPSDTPWQTEFEDSFGFAETDDQLKSVDEIKDDMESTVPMDRLLCGDVGFGKTEVALRAVMKCVMDGKQAAILVPTTVLAQQHYQTAMQRFFGYPVNIDMLSRFRTPAQIRETLRKLREGSVDIVVGTHRLIQKDVYFKELGLLVVDEEQRFGVGHKERLREMAKQVDTLTLSATPIPRTLNMAMSGIRDMSTLEEPPQNRQPVNTVVMEHDWTMVADAIRREVQRGGQVFYLHNRTETIDRVAYKISQMVENISVGVAHGKMSQEQLGSVMEDMVSGDLSVLVCTTIVETGIDIPNANTLIIEDADRLGLSQLHQIRGRVGRSGRRANAYFTFKRDKILSEVAEKRLLAIREFAEFNSGIKIAMRDLEIRGAGNLLGAEQSGHMIDVGYDMYLKLLEEAVLEERGEKPPVRADCAADLAVSANIPESYVKSPEQRMDLYRRIAVIRTEEEADDLMDELVDRFGDPPSGVNALVHVALLRGEAGRAGIKDINQKHGSLQFILEDFDMEAVSKLYSMSKYKGRVKLVAGEKPCISLRLNSKRRAVEEARQLVLDYKDTKDDEMKGTE